MEAGLEFDNGKHSLVLQVPNGRQWAPESKGATFPTSDIVKMGFKVSFETACQDQRLLATLTRL